MKRIPFIAFFIAAGVWLVLAVTSFISASINIAAESTNQNLMEITKSNASVVRHTLSNRITSLQNIASMLEEAGDGYRSSEAMALLARLSQTEGYERLAIDLASGTTFTSDGHTFDITQFDYGDLIRKGEPFVQDVIIALADGAPVICVFVPLQSADGAYEAALRCAITTEAFGELFQQTFYSAGCEYALVDSNGAYIATSQPRPAPLTGQNHYSNMETMTYDQGYSANQIRADGDAKKMGVSRFTTLGEAYHAYYAPAGVNNWQLTMVVPNAEILRQSSTHNTNAFWLLAQIILLLLVATLLIYLHERRAKRQALLNEACFKALVSQTGRVILEWDFDSGKITTMSSFKEMFGRDAVTHSSYEEALTENAVHKDDHAAFREVFSSVLQGNSVHDARFRVVDNKGVYHWCSLSGIVVKGPDGQPYKAIGSLESIEEQVQKEEELRLKAETDSLTNLFNKAATEYLICETLKSRRSTDCRHALFIIDVDHFKTVNDNLGHMYGDSVLASLACMLKNLFRSDDIVGRVGGDEFFIFLKNFNDLLLVRKKAEEVCELFRNNYIDNGNMVSISASIGISLCPEHGHSLEELYKTADIALYEAKKKGRDQYVIFNGDTPPKEQNTQHAKPPPKALS